ncbi:MAG: hypothetical protein OEW04_03145 [Nitrospirota bacterium]|nr:hypothetical protein [Nitrospirota bacterium]
MDGTLLKFGPEKGCGESRRNSCPACGNASLRAEFWEDGTSAHSACRVCMRTAGITELDELPAKKQGKR